MLEELITYHIEAGQSNVEASSNISYEVMIRRAQAIRGLIGWDDLVDIITIKAYLVVGDHGVDMFTEALVEAKRDRATEDEEAEELASKKKPPNSRLATPVERLANRTC